jgi:hypothetical protein
LLRAGVSISTKDPMGILVLGSCRSWQSAPPSITFLLLFLCCVYVVKGLSCPNVRVSSALKLNPAATLCAVVSPHCLLGGSHEAWQPLLLSLE